MARMLLLGALLAFPAAVAATDYRGKVGRLEAVFSLDWHSDGSVTGIYHYPSRQGVRYELRGSNPAEGELRLEEYTDGRPTARCLLRKRLEQGAIVWEGMMWNTDGRRFPMSFSRARGEAPPAVAFDEYTARRRALLERLAAEHRWDSFPLADIPVAMVPVDFEGAEYFGAKVLEFRSDAGFCEMVLLVGEWDDNFELRSEGARRLSFRAARPLPLPPAVIVGSEVAVQVAPDGDLLGIDLTDILVTQVRRGRDGKFEVRGAIELFDVEESFDWDEAALRENLRTAPLVEFLPDKLSLAVDPGEGGRSGVVELGFQSIRIVRDYGITIQSTAAGPGSIELESLSLDAPSDPNPWISLPGLREALKAPPSQYTDQAG